MRRAFPTYRERVAGFIAMLAIVAIIIAVPAGLTKLFGSPIPSELPGGDVLREPVTTETLLAAVVILVWLAWLHFVICLVVEAISAVRDRGLPQPIPFGGASQPLARRLVVTALLLVAAVGAFDRGPDRADSPAGPRRDGIVATAPAMAADGRSDAVRDHVAQRAAAGEAARTRERVEQASIEYDGQLPAGTKIYTVQPPKGRYHDNLWDIAERHLGEGRRYGEIFELNKDREQPDGGRLQLARLIHPGWVLVMPDDASGVDVVPERPPPVESTSVGSSVDVPVAEAAAAVPNLTATDDGPGAVSQSSQPSAVNADESATAADVRDVSSRDFLAAGLLAAGLLSALSTLRELQRRRRPPGALLPVPDPRAVEAEVAMRLVADPESGALLQRALRGLADACAHAGRPFPEVYAVKVDQRGIELQLAAPAVDPPAPFTTDDGGRSWSVDRAAAVAALPAAASPPPLPGLVGLGRDKADDNRHVLIDLESAAGPVAVTGEPALVRAFLSAAAAELATNGWSGDVHVTCLGLDERLRALAPERFRIAVDLDEELSRLERRISDEAGSLLAPGVDSVMTGRLGGGRGELFVGEYLVLGVPPTPAQAARLSALARAGRLSSIGVLSAGPVDGARWRIDVTSPELAAIPVLGLEVVPQRLSQTTFEQVIALATAANREPEPPPTAADAPQSTPRSAVGHLRLVKAVPSEVPLVEVRVLGPLEVVGSTLDEVRRSGRTDELVTFIALCAGSEGVSRSDLITALWPGGASDESVAAALRRARDWLGVDPGTFQPLLQGGDDGPWRFPDSVQLDWDVFQSLTLRSDDDDLRQALELVRGGLLAGRPPGRYAWLARTSLEYDVPVLVADAAHRVARMALLHGDAETAAAAARKGLGIDRDSLALWRDLLEAERHRDPQVADRVAAAMRDRFARGPERRALADMASGW